jgi:hypothetical protein
MTAPTVVPQGAEMKVGPYTLMCLPVATNAPDSNKLDVEATFNRRRDAG